MRSVEPVLPQLRARYAACGCGLVTATLLREPVAAAVSNYRFFPLKQAGDAAAARPLPDWIQANHDPQTKAVLGFNLRPKELPGGQAFARCTPVAEGAALDRLAAFDVVGTTEALQGWLRALATRSGWAPPARPVNAAGQPTDDDRVASAARNAQSYEGDDARWRRDRLEPQLLAAVLRNTRCDTALYAAAQAFAQDAHGRNGTAS